jgi:periplasmic copper chaperone A
MPDQHFSASAGTRYRSGDVRALRILLPLCLTPTQPALLGRGISAGDIRIEHPYATPASGGAGSVYLAQLRNLGGRPERLLGASTPVAERVELQSGRDGGGTLRRFDAVAAIDVEPGADLRMLPGKGARLQLVGLKRALRDGDSFALALQFERAGRVETLVHVQQPR